MAQKDFPENEVMLEKSARLQDGALAVLFTERGTIMRCGGDNKSVYKYIAANLWLLSRTTE